MDALPPSCNHPGGVNIAFADGSVQVHQEPDHLPDMVVLWHSQRPRGHELRRLLIGNDRPGGPAAHRRPRPCRTRRQRRVAAASQKLSLLAMASIVKSSNAAIN